MTQINVTPNYRMFIKHIFSCGLHKPKENIITFCKYLQNMFEKDDFDFLGHRELYIPEN